jgi:hypothetical protein
MPKTERFTFLTDKTERQAIKALAERLQRSQSDAVRLVVREAVQQIAAQPKGEPEPAQAAQP